ncbi:protein involved in gliding motility SprE [Christiangramia gaetbulicola]|uniref:Protein involved in gliding motility SprE n=1 Tax=Christiangramia gaetbulicola TaxID=703340 RepID=A0A2T6AMS0_9FLAO|nr:tetratricopeptide repeat protein [Christiangramia gaetbulicola]PTX45067.1 protein involved in gliding motility SprE [Christiangramia gaetbulicola]
MNTFTRFTLFLVLSAAIFSCSRKKDTFINRNYHAITAEYNTLFNGEMAFEQGREEINQNYADNYWDILPVERLDVDDKILLPDSVRNQNFGRAEEKAVKAIQKHSMQIGGKERNPEMDEAYLLLGKARYFDQRFIPALDAFNYILYRYPASNNINHARIWREKTNVRIGNEKLAIKNLKKILDSDNLEDQDIADASSSLAQAYINLNQIDSAVVPIQNAAEFTKINAEKGRFYFILGQLHDRLGETAEANAAFDEVIELHRKSPRIYYVNAFVEKARNFDFGKGDEEFLLDILTQLEEDRENRPYLDKIYFQLGEYYTKLDSTDKAMEYYNKSLRSRSSDVYLKSVNYEILANINFDRANYQDAGKYYDSTLINMSPDLLEYRSIKKKRTNLDDVIKYEKIAEETDSILRLAGLSEEERIAIFTRYTDDLREKAVREMEAGELPVYTASIGPQNNFSSASVPPAGEGNAFYFYNPLRVSRGAQEFLRVWGTRELKDNWRWGSTAMNQSSVNAQERLMDINLDNDPLYDPMTYVSQIPGEQSVLDSLATQRNLAYFQLGVIYNENYKEYELAAEKLEFLLENDPQERLILPAKYNLYNIYGAQGRLADQERLRNDILQNYSDSRYAAFIRDPQSIQRDENSPDLLYNALFRKYEDQQYQEVIDEANEYVSRFTGDPIVPKFELLKARAAARLMGVDAYEKALNYVAVTYPQTTEGRKAQNILNTSIPELKGLEFSNDSIPTSYKLIFPLDNPAEEEAEKLKKTIEKALSELDYNKFSVSIDVYDIDQTFVVVHGLSEKSRSLGFQELLKENKNYKIDRQAFVMSAENYRIVQIKKTLRSYLDNY